MPSPSPAIALVTEPAATPALSRAVTALFAVAAGLAVANVYYAQPLLDAMAGDLGIARATVGVVVTMTQVGVGLGLLLVVPLGDLVDRRRLIPAQLGVAAAALLVVGNAHGRAALLGGLCVVGLVTGVVQVLVAFAADLAAPAERGRAVGTVTSGVVLGILMARTVAGALADLAGWRAVYLVSSVAMLVMAATLLVVLPRRQQARAPLSYPRLLASLPALFAAEPVLRVRATLALLMFAAFSALWTSMVLVLSAPPLGLSHTHIGLFGLAGAAGALAASRAGAWADRGLGQRVSGAALALLVASWLPIALTRHSLWALIAGVVAFDLAVQALHVTNQTLIYATRPEARSRLVALYMAFYSVGSAGGSIASTLAYARAGWLGVCGLGAAISAVALVFWAVTRPRAA